MNTLLKSYEFDVWLSGLRDVIAKAQVIARIRSAQLGNFGDQAPVGGGVYEMRIHVGPGYRLYYTRTDNVVYLLLLGGTKKSQQRDIDNPRNLS
ncbi:MAG: hypothetical protein RL497_2194 [Pseudomonadota bacterium]|jgi:putative addiction module killer protein